MFSGNDLSFNGPESALLYVMIIGNMLSLNAPESALLHVTSVVTICHLTVQNQHYYM